jgi:hypothetical protein
MPQWIHERAEHLLAKNPSMPKGEAFAVATQQSHALGKSPKGYGTLTGRQTAKAKFDTPKDDKKTANPGNLETPKLKAAGLMQALTTPIPGTPKLLAGSHVGEAFSKALHGLGSAAPAATAATTAARAAGPKTLNDIQAARRAMWKTSSVTLAAFADELEKIALSPQLEAKGAISGLMRKAERLGAVDKLKNTNAWQQLQTHAKDTGLPFSKERNPIFSKLHDRLGTYLKQQGASS